MAADGADEVIALPTGGGALRGVGETFTPDLRTGAGNANIPLDLPAGRNGFNPALSLVYSTGNGNSAFGLGWSLEVATVARKTVHGVPRYDADDVFLLAQSEDLVAVEELADGQRYRPRTEGLFARIEHRRTPGSTFWDVRTKDGLRSLYGARMAGGAAAFAADAVVRDPRRPERVFEWKLGESLDPFGNLIEYEYELDAPADEGRRRHQEMRGHTWAGQLLKRISYVDFTAGAATRFLVSVSLEYEDRPDPFSTYNAGFEIRRARRCTGIVIRTHADAAVPQPVRRYELVYLDARLDLDDLEALLPLNGVSLLSQVRVMGFDDNAPAAQAQAVEELPPIDLSYTRFEPRRRRFEPLDGENVPAESLASQDLAFVDVDGNGLPDIVELNGVARWWRNVGGRFDSPRSLSYAPAARLADPGVRLLDADGDGRADLLVPQASGYFPMRADAGWDAFRRYKALPTVDLADPEVRLLDLDGDGVTDAVRSGASFECFFNSARPDEAWTRTRRVRRQRVDSFPDVSFADQRVRIADMTGDGMQDIVLATDRCIEYWPNLGHGDWGSRIRMERPPMLPRDHLPRDLLFGDVDGDGVADVVFVGRGYVLVWINRGGNSWSDPIQVIGTPVPTETDDVRTADVFGTGIDGVLWTAQSSAGRRTSMFFLDLSGRVKPYLLNRIDNNIGASTAIDYRPSTDYYLADLKRADTRWRTPLPFPVQVVARVASADRVSGGTLTTDYSYHDGYWDGIEREFRGFRRVDQLDTEVRAHTLPGDTTAPPLEKRTWFHLGAVVVDGRLLEDKDLNVDFTGTDPPLFGPPDEMAALLRRLTGDSRRDAIRSLRGLVVRSELYARDGSDREACPFTVTDYTYGVSEVLDGAGAAVASNRVFFPHLRVERTTEWDRGDDPRTTIKFLDGYDALGRVRDETSVALPRRKAKQRPLEGAVVGKIAPDPTTLLASLTRAIYARPDQLAYPDLYVHDRVAHTVAFAPLAASEPQEAKPADLRAVLTDHSAAAVQVREALQTALEGWAVGDAIPVGLQLLRHTRNLYDGSPYTGRPDGQVGPFGTLTRSEALVFTEAQLDYAYGPLRPTYLDGTEAPPAAAPAGFGTAIGYARRAASAGRTCAGYYASTASKATDARGLVTGMRDALGNQTDVDYDTYSLLPTRVTNAVGLETVVTNSYRMLKPLRVIEPNGTASHFRYSPTGLVQERWTEAGVGEGGTEAKPDVRYAYDFLAFARSAGDPAPQPVFVHTYRRTQHARAGGSDETLEMREYSDGFGRVVQKRTQAEELAFDDIGLPAAPGSTSPAVGKRSPGRVAVSGWVAYDNKGRIVAAYEPFFGDGWGFQPETEARVGSATETRYDARGRVVRTIRADRSETWEIFGRPRSLDTPTAFDPSPWETSVYDANDLAPLLQAPATQSTRAPPTSHRFSPVTRIFDALGRAVCQIERRGPTPASDWVLTRSSYDLRGNLLRVFDAFGRTAFEYAYDMQDRVLRRGALDDGDRTFVLDALGNAIAARDANGGVVLRQHDGLNRLVQLWARDEAHAQLTLREAITYGDDGSANQSPASRAANRARNRLGRIARHHDEAGLVEYRRYDFRANVVEKARTVVSDAALAAGWTADWSAAAADDALESAAHVVSTHYDALNRPVEVTYPREARPRTPGAPRQRAVMRSFYNRAGALVRQELDGAAFIAFIAYDARGQRVLSEYGNGLMTRFAYDPLTFRVARSRTEAFTRAAASDTWSGQGAPLRDCTYSYDPSGNVVEIDERTPACGVAGALHGRDRLVRKFSYDALYRLTSATGRACKGTADPLADVAACGSYAGAYMPGPPTPNQANAPDLTEDYTETYVYDPAGNLLKSTYAAQSGQTTCRFGIGGRTYSNWRQAATNRATSLRLGSSTHMLGYDACGRLDQQDTDRHLGWDHADRLIEFRIQAGAQPTLQARYLYAADGARVKKWVRKGAGAPASTVYIEGVFELRTWREAGAAKRGNSLHVIGAGSRVAIVDVGDRPSDDAGPPVCYHLGDHLESSVIVVAAGRAWVNREEYFPYGRTSFGSYARKRYRFCGRERDEESGLSHHGARYYAPHLQRWISADPMSPAAGLNPYRYARGSPITFHDVAGFQEERGNQDAAAQQQSLEDVQKEHLGGLMHLFGLDKAHKQYTDALNTDDHAAEALSEARQVEAHKVTQAAEVLETTGEVLVAAQPAPEAEADAVSTGVARKVGNAIEEGKSLLRKGADGVSRILEWGAEQVSEKASAVSTYARTVIPELSERLGRTSFSGMAWIEDVGEVLLKPAAAVKYESKLAATGLDDLAKLRMELALPKPGPGSPTLARLDIGGKSFYGWSGAKDITLKVNPVSRFHAEADVFEQAVQAGASGGTATLYVDYPTGLCLACFGNGGVEGLARQLGLREIQVVAPNASFPLKIAP